MWLTLYNQRKLQVLVELSSVCNAACPQCDRFKPGTLDTHEFLQQRIWTVSEFRNAFEPDDLQHMENILFSGLYGEPTTCKDLLDIVKYVRDVSPDTTIDITTNGSTRTTEWWQELGRIGGSKIFIQFDIDGINQEMHSRYRRNTSLAKILDNMDAYASTNPGRHSILTVVYAHNKPYLKQIRELAIQHGAVAFDQLESARFFQERGAVYKYQDRDGNDHQLEQVDETLLSLIPDSRKIRNFKLEDNVYSDDTHAISCSAAAERRLQLDYNGNVWPCCWIQTAVDHGTGSSDPKIKYLQDLRASGKINVFKHSLGDILSTDWLNGGLEESISSCITANKACIKWCSNLKDSSK